MDGRKRNTRHLIGGALAIGALLSFGCATQNWPIISKQMISQGEKAINEARAGTASMDAPEELKAAEEKLSLAKKEFAEGWHNNASRLAKEAAVDAEYARAKATSEKEKQTVKEMQANIDTLRQEIERQSR
jgi:capsule polysaccharide export protein KpsE/RkpR